MSLIDEALKRARQEAARQDEAARELRYRQVPVIPGLRQPARRSWLLPAIISACLAVGIGIGLFLASRGGDDQRAAVPPPLTGPVAAPAPQEQPAESPQVAEVPPPPLPVPVIEEEEPSLDAEEPAPAPAEPPARPVREEEPVIADLRQREITLTPPAPRPQPAPEPVGESEPPAPAPPVVSAPAPEPVPAPAVAGQERIYQQEMPLPGGGTLRLNGIAFSEQPVALFGDKVVAPGESVAGFKVLSIEARRVRLEAQGGVVVVELE